MEIREIFERRSIRKYQNTHIEKEKTDKLLKAAMQAPSACNQQPWEFIVVQDKKLLSALSETSPFSKLVADAPLGTRHGSLC